MKTMYARVHGIVQGVGYRHLVKEAATRLGISGSVKNEIDGSVSIIAVGDEKRLDRFFSEITVDHSGGPSVFKIEFTNERPEHSNHKEDAGGDFAVVG